MDQVDVSSVTGHDVDETAPAAQPVSESTRRVAVDFHVHLYDAFAPGALLDAAVRHRPTGVDTVVLCLTDTAKERGFARWAEIVPTPWSMTPTAEDASACFVHDGVKVFVIDGYQAKTAERLEVLAVGTDAAPTDGLSLDEALEAARATGALVVLPYGVGKWTGARKAMVERAVEGHGEWLCVGDNGNRRAGAEPGMIASARAAGLPVLPGSDPLPMSSGQAARAGSFGGVADVPWDDQRPAESLVEAVRHHGLAFEPFGRATGVLGFAWAQVAMQVRGVWK